MQITIDVFPVEGPARTDVVDVALPGGSPDSLRGLSATVIREQLLELAQRRIDAGARAPTFEAVDAGVSITVQTAGGSAVIRPLPLLAESVNAAIRDYTIRRESDAVLTHG